MGGCWYLLQYPGGVGGDGGGDGDVGGRVVGTYYSILVCPGIGHGSSPW